MSHMSKKVLAIALILVLLVSGLAIPAAAQEPAATPNAISFTILHTNDFHGQLEPSGSNPGMARVAKVVNDVRTAVGADSVLLVDAGDRMQGSLISNLKRASPPSPSSTPWGTRWGPSATTSSTGANRP